MKNHEQAKSEQLQASEPGKMQDIGRRAFIVSVAGAVSGVVFWGLRKATLVDPQPVSAAGAPANVTIVEFAANGKKTGKVTMPHIAKSDAEWKSQLSPESYEVTRRAGTERPYTGATWNLHEKGIFRCICCETALFSSDTKFDSGTGWPSFWQPIARENVNETSDSSMGMDRTAVSCRRCDAHLGHVFPDGPPPTGLRYCMNSAAMHFVKLA
jgi:peptide-methionine (R)-S-oxide reductase